MQDVEIHAPIIGCFHVSNRSARPGMQHLPLRHPDGDIVFDEFLMTLARREFHGPVVLEYLPDWHGHLLPDALWARNPEAV